MAATPDPSRPIILLTDVSLQSYAVIGRLYRLTLEALGYTIDERPLPRPGESESALSGAGWVLHNTIGPRFDPIPGAYNVALPHHEWSRYPRGWTETLNRFDEVWTTSDHVRNALTASGVTAPVRILAPALDADDPPVKTAWAPTGPFRFFSCGEAHFRKGFHLLMEGFTLAFPEPDEATLTIKTGPGCVWESPRKDITIDTGDRGRDELLGSYKTYDAYVSASLGEGLGLPVAEAALCKLPITANRWGGHASLLTGGGFWEIPHIETHQPFCSDPSYYAPGQMCAYSPPVDIAVALREVFDASPDERRMMAEKARAHLIARYGRAAVIENFRRRFSLSEESVDALKRNDAPLE